MIQLCSWLPSSDKYYNHLITYRMDLDIPIYGIYVIKLNI